MDPEGCNDQDAPDCPQARGGIYDRGESSTSQGVLTSGSSSDRWKIFPLQAQTNLGMWNNSDVGRYGYDAVEIGRPGNGNISLIAAQVIATVATKDFFLGNLGLSARRVSAMGSGRLPGLLTSLNDGNYIPSLSYGYTAGAEYSKKSNGSPSFTLITSRKEQCKPDFRRIRPLQVHVQRHRILSSNARDARVDGGIGIGSVDGSERK